MSKAKVTETHKHAIKYYRKRIKAISLAREREDPRGESSPVQKAEEKGRKKKKKGRTRRGV